jgi:hexosaminidase
MSINLIPKPASVTITGGFFRHRLPPAEGDFPEEIAVFNGQMNGGVKDQAARIRCVRAPEKPAEHAAKFPLTNEGYRLVISPDLITVSAQSGSGAYHGLQSVRQLFLPASPNGEAVIPCAEIEDLPRFPWRGFMLDCSRYFYTVPFIKKIIDALSLHHINIFHWHLTDDQGWRFPVPAYPLLTEIGSVRKDRRFYNEARGGFYTEKDIRDLAAFAASRHVELAPEVDLPGHALAILAAYPELGCTGGPYEVEDRYGIFEDVLCAGNDRIFDFAGAVFDTLASLFPSKWVHMGGDEVPFRRWEQCPKCQKRLAETGLPRTRELQGWIMAKLARMLLDRGKTPIGWDEILDGTEHCPLPGEAVIMSWRGRDGGTKALRQGRRVIMCPNTEGCYLDYKHADDPEEPGQLGISSISAIYGMDPAASCRSSEETALVLGGQANLWSELIYAGKIAEYMIFPRICALAEALWSAADQKDEADFRRRLPLHQERLTKLDLLQYRGN